MNCFGFGTTFSSTVLLDLSTLIRQTDAHDHQTIGSHAAEYSLPSGVHAKQMPSCIRHNGAHSQPVVSSAAAECLLPANDHGHHMPACNGNMEDAKQGLAVARLQAKVAKDALKSLGWLDQTYKAQTDADRDLICLPLTGHGSTRLHSLQLRTVGKSDNHSAGCLPDHRPDGAKSHTQLQTSLASIHLFDPESSMACQAPLTDQRPSMPNGSAVAQTNGSQREEKGKAFRLKGKAAAAHNSHEADKACLIGLLQSGHAVVRSMHGQKPTRGEGSPAKQMHMAVTELLQHQVGLRCCAGLCSFTPSCILFKSCNVALAKHLAHILCMSVHCTMTHICCGSIRHAANTLPWMVTLAVRLL